MPATPDRFLKSPGPCATASSSAAALLLSQTTTTKDSSPPSICLGFNSLLAHLSWAIKHARDEPRDLPLCCIWFYRAGRGKAPSPPGSAQEQGEGDVPRGGTRPCLLPEQSGSVGHAGAPAASFCPCNATSCSGGGEEQARASRSCYHQEEDGSTVPAGLSLRRRPQRREKQCAFHRAAHDRHVLAAHGNLST